MGVIGAVSIIQQLASLPDGSDVSMTTQDDSSELLPEKLRQV